MTTYFRSYDWIYLEEKYKNLSLIAKCMYCYLRTFQSNCEEVYPSYKTLMEYFNVKSKSTISNSLKELVDVGLLVKESRPKKSTKYLIYDRDGSKISNFKVTNARKEPPVFNRVYEEETMPF